MITVHSPGARTLVQDQGRSGYEHLGVPTSGAADLPSLRLANRLLGNDADAAALEVALNGPTLTFANHTHVAYAGAPTDLQLDGKPVPAHHTIPVAAGQTLTIGAVREGVYGYLAVAGGITSIPVLGSRSSCTLSGLGPAPLSAGDTLPTATTNGPQRYLAARAPDFPAVIRYLDGPHAALFTDADRHRFASTDWSVSPATSRVGVRLSDGQLAAPQQSVPSMGTVTGAVQVPPNGEPIILAPDHGTTGGYPVLAVVLPCDMPALLQRLPGSPVRFQPVTPADAISADREASRRLSFSLWELDRISA